MFASDISKQAVEIASQNATDLEAPIHFIISDGLNSLRDQTFDAIVSNPPYIPTADLAGLPPEVRNFDPWLALDGGFDGLAAYRRIMPRSRSLLAPGGWLLAEFGANQAAGVNAIANQCGFTDVTTYQDLAGADRIVAIRR